MSRYHFDPNDYIYSNVVKTKSKLGYFGLTKYFADLASPTASHSCRGLPEEDVWIPASPLSHKAYTPKYDIVNSEPASVALNVMQWKCLICRRTFADPNYPYHNVRKITRSFGDFLVKSIILDPRITEEAIASLYELTSATVSGALSSFIEELENIPFAEFACSKIWVVIVKIGKKDCSIIFGEPTDEERRRLWDYFKHEQYVLLGVTQGYKIEDIIKSSRSLNWNNPELVFVCPHRLKAKAEEHFGRVETYKDESDLPKDIHRIRNTVSIMDNWGQISIKSVELRLMLHDGFRSAEIEDAKQRAEDGTKENIVKPKRYLSLDDIVNMRDVYEENREHLDGSYYYMQKVSTALALYEKPLMEYAADMPDLNLGEYVD